MTQAKTTETAAEVRAKAELKLVLEGAHAQALMDDRAWAEDKRRQKERAESLVREEAELVKGTVVASALNKIFRDGGFGHFEPNKRASSDRWYDASIIGSWKMSVKGETEWVARLCREQDSRHYRTVYTGKYKIKIEGWGIDGPARFGVTEDSARKIVARILDAKKIREERLKAEKKRVEDLSQTLPRVTKAVANSFPEVKPAKENYWTNEGEFSINSAGGRVRAVVKTSSFTLEANFHPVSGLLESFSVSNLKDGVSPILSLTNFLENVKSSSKKEGK